MSNALLAGVSGLQAHQTMLDVAGNNLANVNTSGFKTARVTFSELLSETLREATQPTETTGGTNAQQVGSGVRVSAVDRNMTQGSMVQTGQPLDMAIDGAGYFVLSDGEKNMYTRVGVFAVDADYYLVDPGTGYRVQRIGSEGLSEGFQGASSNDIRIPYDVALAAKATETVRVTGNLSANLSIPTTATLLSGTVYTAADMASSVSTLLTDLDQVSGLAVGETISITGAARDGTAVNGTFTIAANSTIGDLIDAVTAAFPGSTATLWNGQLKLTDNQAGYSQTDVTLEYNGAGTFELPDYFKIEQAGGQETRLANIEIFDSLGVAHNAAAAFTRTTEANTWDMVLMSVTGDVNVNDRRIKSITFDNDGALAGMGGAVPDELRFQVAFGFDPGNVRNIAVDMGTVGELDGLSQLGGGSTAVASGQDGFESGYLSSISVSRDGVVIGMFTNGERQNIAALQLASFQNPAGLQTTGGGYFEASANSGDAIPTKALSGGAGAVSGGSLEKSNVDMASEFVNLIQAQNGYQANARTIRVANDMLRELATLIR